MPDRAATAMMSSSTTTTTTQQTLAYSSTVVEVDQSAGAMDRRYIKGVPGLLKLLEAVLSLIAFICVTASATVCLPWVATTGFFNFITMACFVMALLMWIMLLLKLQRRIFCCDCVNWPLFEFAFYGVLVVLLFFGALFMALHQCHIAHQVGAAFAFFALVVFLVDFAFATRTWLASRQGVHTSSAHATTTTVGENKY